MKNSSAPFSKWFSGSQLPSVLLLFILAK